MGNYNTKRLKLRSWKKDTNNNLPLCATAMPSFQHPCPPDGIWTSGGLITWMSHAGVHPGQQGTAQAKEQQPSSILPSFCGSREAPRASLEVMMDTHWRDIARGLHINKLDTWAAFQGAVESSVLPDPPTWLQSKSGVGMSSCVPFEGGIVIL